MIKTRKDLEFFMMADLMMNRGKFKLTMKDQLVLLLGCDNIVKWLRIMRKCSYLSSKRGVLKVIYKLYYFRYITLSERLGFDIGFDTFGYGLRIPHAGTILANRCKIGNYAVLHTSICIAGNGKEIGDALYVGPGVKMTSKLKLGDNVSIGANSVVNRSFEENNVLLGGMPAKIIKESQSWYVRDGLENRVNAIEKLKKEMYNVQE